MGSKHKEIYIVCQSMYVLLLFLYLLRPAYLMMIDADKSHKILVSSNWKTAAERKFDLSIQ